jgi:acetyl esterase
MPLHPQARAHLERLADSNFADLHAFAPEQVRQGMRLMTHALGEGQAVASVRDRVIATPAGDLPIRIYHPQPDQTRPVVVFFHGGGFVLGDLDTHDELARALANRCGRVVVSVDYPLAPEHKYPAAINAAFAATTWVSDNAAELGGDGADIAVAGDSAGGNLAEILSRPVDR